MPGLQLAYTTPRGVDMILPAAVFDLQARLEKGDPTHGWTGDNRMHICWNPLHTRYEIFRWCEDGKERFVLSFSPDQLNDQGQILKRLGAGDGRARDVLAEVEAHNASIQRDHDRRAQEWEDELRERQLFLANHYATGSDDYTPREGQWYLKEQAEKTADRKRAERV